MPVSFTLVARDCSDSSFPPVLPSLGLSHKRQSYLYQKIRQFVPDKHKDELCLTPEPESVAAEMALVPILPVSDVSVDQSADSAADVCTSYDKQPERLATLRRKPPKCSNCGQIGHRNLASQCPMRKGEPKKAKRQL